MQPPLVSAVIPAHNAARYVRGAVKSVLDQTYAHLEVIVVDDGSTDGTASAVLSLEDPRLRLIRTENRGVGAARNLGWRRSNGDLIAFLDADDRWFREKLATQVAFLHDHPEVGLVGTLMRYETPTGRCLGVTGVAPLGPHEHSRMRNGKLMPFPISSILVRRPVLEALGGFDERLAHAFPGLVEDIDLVARAARITIVACVPVILGVYRLHSASASARHFDSQRAGVRFVRARLQALEQGRDLDVAEFVASYRPTFRQRWGDLVARAYRRAGTAAADGRWRQAALWGLVSILLGPRYTLTRLSRQRPWELARHED